MAQPESGGPPQEPPAEEMHWAIHISEDIKDLRLEVRDHREQHRHDLRELRTEVRGDIQGLRTELGELRAQVDARFVQVDARFAQVDARFAQVDRRLDELRRTMDTRFYWTIGIMVTLFGAQTALIAALAQL